MDLDNNLSVESDNTCGINVIAFENKCMCSRSNGENYCYRISYLTSFENVTFQAIGWDFLAVLRFITDTTAFLWYESHLKLKLQGERMGTNTMPVQVQVLSMQSFWLRTQFKKKKLRKNWIFPNLHWVGLYSIECHIQFKQTLWRNATWFIVSESLFKWAFTWWLQRISIY